MIGLVRELIDDLRRPVGDDTPFGLLAVYETAADLYEACEKVRDGGYRRWDAHSPFPVHGLNKAMGLKPSPLAYICFVAAMLGASGALLLQWWTSAVDYPLVIAGKPYFSWPAFIPITFELGVLCTAFAAVFGMFALNQLPRLHHPLFHSKAFERVTDDAFFISIEAADPSFDVAVTRKFLEESGAKGVELVPR